MVKIFVEGQNLQWTGVLADFGRKYDRAQTRNSQFMSIFFVGNAPNLAKLDFCTE